MSNQTRFSISVMALACAAAVASTSAQVSTVAPAVRVGIFDSRAVAVAYYNSDRHRAEIRGMMEQLRAAKAANDTAAGQRLEQKGRALQNLAHYQAFSTASVPNVLEPLKDVLPQVAKDTGVSLIVSKWEIAWQDPHAEYVDITERLVDVFHPDARVRKSIDELKATTPMPLVEAVATLKPER